MATANESGYGAFLPKHRNEMVNREALRGQMVKQASYLTGMDSTYAQLDEQARQFDLSLEQRESQFGRKLDYEYDALEKQAAHWDAQISLGWGQQRSSERIASQQAETSRYGIDASAQAESDRLAFQQEGRNMEYAFKEKEYETNAAFTASLMANYLKDDETTKDPVGNSGQTVKPEQQTIQSGEVAAGYDPPTYAQYDYSNQDPWVSGGYLERFII